jgi:transmembrane sensor
MSRAQDIEAKAAEWLMRREQPQYSQADQAALDRWLNESMSHKAAFWRLEHAWQMADRIGARSARDVGPHPRRRGLPLKWWQGGVLAASLLLAIAFIGLHSRPALSPQPRVNTFDTGIADTGTVDTFDTGIGGHRIVPLVDGSRIELNTATILRTNISNERRDVWLDRGEAFFEVAHIEGSAFVVHAGPRMITVVGTQFSVRRDGDKVTVAVVKGRVRVEDTTPGASSASITVTAGDVAIGLGSSTMVVSKPVAAVEDKLTWRDGRLVFDGTSLAEVADDFNRYNRQQLLISDPSVAAIRISGTFKASNVEAFVRLLKEAYGLKVELTAGGTLEIST